MVFETHPHKFVDDLVIDATALVGSIPTWLYSGSNPDVYANAELHISRMAIAEMLMSSGGGPKPLVTGLSSWVTTIEAGQHKLDPSPILGL